MVLDIIECVAFVTASIASGTVGKNYVLKKVQDYKIKRWLARPILGDVAMDKLVYNVRYPATDATVKLLLTRIIRHGFRLTTKQMSEICNYRESARTTVYSICNYDIQSIIEIDETIYDALDNEIKDADNDRYLEVIKGGKKE